MNRVIIMILAVVFTAGLAFSAPEPAVVQGVGLWTVDVSFRDPLPIRMKVDGKEKPQLFWYVIVTLTNRTTQDVDFYPTATLVTDTYDILPESCKTPPSVFEQIRKRHELDYPLLESLPQAGNRILQGSDNAKDIALIWPDFDVKAKGVKIFLAGLSNETTAIDHPRKEGKIFLRKTLELDFTVGGDPVYRVDTKFKRKSKRWVMR